MKVTRYLNQTAQYRAFTGRDEWGAPAHAPAVTIKVRKKRKNKWQRTKGELTLVSVTEYMSEQKISLGDLMDDEEIYAVEDVVDFDGSVIATQSYPRPPLGFTP